jgi:hypothetical protein
VTVGSATLQPYVLVHIVLRLQAHGALEWATHAHLQPLSPPTALDVFNQAAGLNSPCVRARLPVADSVWSFIQTPPAGAPSPSYSFTHGGYLRVALRRRGPRKLDSWPVTNGSSDFLYLHVLLAHAAPTRPAPLPGPLNWANALLYRVALRLDKLPNYYLSTRSSARGAKRQARAALGAAPPRQPCATL